jgi:hypothetical protein
LIFQVRRFVYCRTSGIRDAGSGPPPVLRHFDLGRQIFQKNLNKTKSILGRRCIFDVSWRLLF